VEKGMDLYLLNRGQTNRPVPNDVKIIKADIRNPEQTKSILMNYTFDVVVDWIAYNPEHVKNDYEIFMDKTSQFIFISSASAYQKPPSSLQILIGNTQETKSSVRNICFRSSRIINFRLQLFVLRILTTGQK
jgi:hypothetical protein